MTVHTKIDCLVGDGPCTCASQDTMDAMFAFVVVDPNDGKEGVPAFYSPVMKAHMPMMGADIERAKSMRDIAQTMANEMGKRIELVRFVEREHVEWIEPK